MVEAEENPYESPLARGLPHVFDIPYWVKERLTDLPDRPAAIRKFKRELLLGVLFFPIWFFAAWRWAAIRWMDRHNRWEALPIPSARIRGVELAVVVTIVGALVAIGVLPIPSCDHRYASHDKDFAPPIVEP